MKVFFADLDNTLIYSYKRDIGEDKVCVEHYQGREISYMTSRSHLLLQKICDRIDLIPITTRSVEQYQRIHLFADWSPQQALVCNGGVLLREGQADKNWYEDSLDLVADSRTTLQDAVGLLEKDDNRSLEVRTISNLFVFTKSRMPDKTISTLEGQLDSSLVDVMQNGEKIYVVPKKLNKGAAMLRMQEKLGADYVIAAGDSEFDCSMLQLADTAFIPEMLEGSVPESGNRRVIAKKEFLFSDMILEKLQDYLDIIC